MRSLSFSLLLLTAAAANSSSILGESFSEMMSVIIRRGSYLVKLNQEIFTKNNTYKADPTPQDKSGVALGGKICGRNMKYLIPTYCTMFLLIIAPTCFGSQFLAIFRELISLWLLNLIKFKIMLMI
jgi:hypothetical protein